MSQHFCLVKPRKPIRMSWCLGISLLLSATIIQTYAQQRASFASDSLPAQAVKRVKVEVDLQPGQATKVSIPLWKSGSMISVRLNGLQPVTRPPLSNSKSSNTFNFDEISKQRIQQQKERSSPISFLLQLPNGDLSPMPNFSGRNKFLIEVKDAANTGTGVLKNISNQPLKGTLLIASVDAAERSRVKKERQKREIEEKIRDFSNPDILWIINHTLKRQLQGYPGGKSALETRVVNALNRANISSDVLQKIVDGINTFEPQLKARVRDKRLLQLTSQMPAPEPVMKKAPQPTPSRQAYSIRLLGIKSHRCADDVGWEFGCNAEEPYVVWTAFSSSFARVGHTESGSDIEDGDEFLYEQDVNVFSSAIAKPDATVPSFPLIFIYQVIEDDPGGPSREEVLEVVKGGVETGKALFDGNFEEAATSAAPLLVNTFDLMMKIAGGGDDRFPVLMTIFDGKRMLTMTSGNSPGPLNGQLFEHPGNYNHLSIQVPVVKGSDGTPQWSLAYMITRIGAH